MEADELIGSWLGPYQVLERLGEGGMARVYKGIQPRLKRYVALKIILPEAAARPGFRERFEREAQAIARLQHNNIVAVYDFGEANNLTYLVMQYVGGGTLSGTLKKDQSLSPILATKYTIQMARALHHAHSQGIIHRDIKPSNMLLDEKDPTHLLLSDFGIAKLLSSPSDSEQGQLGLPQPITTAGNIIGTPEFMAPEQAQGSAVDARTDIYALGMVLYVLLTGRLPFRSTTPLGILYQQVHTSPPPIREMNPTVPPALVQTVAYALAKRPEDRFQTAEDFARGLENVLGVMQGDDAPTRISQIGPTMLAPNTPSGIPGTAFSGALSPLTPTVTPHLTPAGSYSTHPQPNTAPTTPASQQGIPPGIGAYAAPSSPLAAHGRHSAATILPGQAPGVVVPSPARPRRPLAPWLITGVSLLIVAALVVFAVRGNLLSGLLAAGGSATPTTQAGQTPITSAVIDTFKVDTNGWQTGHINGDPGLNWNVGGGIYDLVIPGGKTYSQSYFPTPANLAQPPANFTLEVKVKQAQGSTVLGYGLIFREATVTQGSSEVVNCYAFTINSHGQYQFQVYRNSLAAQESFSTASPNPLDMGLGQINDLKVVVAGSTFKLYANGQLLPGPNNDNSWTDTSYASGQVGLLITGDGTEPQEYQFTYFALTPM